VISLLEYPDMMQGDLLPIAEKIYPKDVLKRAKGLWEEIGSVGAYSASKGLLGIRKRVAKFLEGESPPADRQVNHSLVARQAIILCRQATVHPPTLV